MQLQIFKKRCNICKDEIYMQNMQFFALPTLLMALPSSNSAPAFNFEKGLSKLSSITRFSHRFPHVEHFSLRRVEEDILLAASNSRGSGVGLRTGFVKKSGSVHSIHNSKQVAIIIGVERGLLGCLKEFFDPLIKRNSLQTTM